MQMRPHESPSTVALPETSSPLYLDLLAKLSDPVSIIAGQQIVFVNQAYARQLGYDSPSDLIGRMLGEIIDPRDREMVLARGQQRQRGENPPDFYQWRAIGRYRTHTLQIRAIPALYKNESAVLVISRDVTEREETEEKLKMALSLLEATLEATADGISTVSLDGTVINYNRRFIELMGISQEELELRLRSRDWFRKKIATYMKDPEGYIVQTVAMNATPEETHHFVMEFKDGRTVECYTFPQKVGGETVGVVWSLRDITERRQLEALLLHQASHDYLTGLLNRRGFEEALNQSLQGLYPAGALLLLDLDQFKDVNDSLGHPAGDEVLTSLADMLKRTLPASATIARLGGDEFGIILTSVSQGRAEAVGHQVLSALNRRVFQTSAGDRVRLTCSLGVVLYPPHGSTVEQLMSRVDLALYSAKEKGRNRFTIYSPIERRAKKSETRLWIRSRIREALEKDEMVLYAQPIIDLKNGSIAQQELLVRLPLEDGTILRAGQFIGLAERSGLILAIDTWVVSQAIKLLKQSQELGQTFALAVNLSGAAFEDSRLLQAIDNSLRGMAVDTSRLIFEVTETAAVSNVTGAQRFMTSLKEMGCRFSIDDFGVGFSSMTQLKHLPVDFLKLDGSFIRHIRSSKVDQEVVKAMVSIAGAMGLSTIAEAVRSAPDVEMLAQLGVGYGQGFFLGRPRPADRLLTDTRSRAA
ncbi:MAG: putative bifunctional diguanylate cyclase/phosphodiesterase [Dehalococcoidia bacterium]